MENTLKALEWYRETCHSLMKAMVTKNTTTIEAIVTALALDKGDRAAIALRELQGDKPGTPPPNES